MDGTRYPLTFGQEQLLYLDRMGEPGVLVRPLSIPMPAGLDAHEAVSALTRVVRRHDALRMGVSATPDGDFQVAAASRPVEVLPAGADPEAYGALDLWTEGSGQPLFVSIDAARPGLVVYLHHLFVDGWSAALVLGDFHRCYGGGGPDPVAESFGRYARQQRRTMTGDTLAAHLGFWADELAGAAPLRLPYASNAWRPGLRSVRCPALVFEVPGVSMGALLSGTPAFGRSGAVAALAGLAAAVSEATGQRDLLVHTDMADRGAVRRRDTVGCLVNRVTLRLRLPDRLTAATVATAARAAWSRAARHQTGPFQQQGRTTAAGQVLNLSPRVTVTFNQDLLRRAAADVTARQSPRSGPPRRNPYCLIWDSSAAGGNDLQLLIPPGPVNGPFTFVLAYRPDLWDRDGAELLGTAVARWLTAATA